MTVEPTAIPDKLTLPFEREERQSDNDVEGSLFELLGSDPEFSESEEPEAGEPEPEEDPGAEEESDDDEPEAEPEVEDDEDDDAEEPEVQARYRVKVQGEEIEVTLDELKAGWSRTQDYTRKTTEAAEIKRAAAEERDRYAAQIDRLQGVLLSQLPPEPDWDKLRKENPAEFAAQFAEGQKRKEDLQALQSERQRIWVEQQGEREAQYREDLAAEQEKMLSAIPEWRDPEVGKVARTKLKEYAQSAYGWTEAELANVTDHRLMVVLKKAQAFDELKGKAGSVKEKAVTSATLRPGGRTPGAPKKTGKKNAARQALDRLARDGSPDSAAHAIELLLGPSD